LTKTVGVPIIVVSRKDDNVIVINALLRQAGTPVHCTRVEHFNDFEKALREQTPEMVIIFDEKGLSGRLPSIAKRLSKLEPSPPLLLAKSEVTEQSISKAMAYGARDVVSLTHEGRFQSVVDRELQAYRMQLALGGVMRSANQYKEELKNLMEGSAEAIAEVQEGIVVAANAPWLELLGYQSEKELLAVPFMDLCDEGDQPMLKGALVACLREKWDGSTIKIRGLRANGDVTPIGVTLERILIDEEAAVRVAVAGKKSQQESPVELLEQAVHKDPATGFYHRHFFLEKLEERMAVPLTGGVRAIAYIRPDSFSRVHQEIGMLATEQLLTQLAGLLKDFMNGQDLYGRFGGTMFVSVIERGTMNDVEVWAEQVRKAIAGHGFNIDGQTPTLTCTVGLTEFENKHTDLSEIFSDVEEACRVGRKAGGDRVQMTRDTSESQVVRKEDAEWGPRLRAALLKKQFRLVHQPVSSLNEDIEEALDTRVQMLDEAGEPVLAGEFISAAERTGLIKNIDRWVINASLSFCKKKDPNLLFIRLSRDSILDKTLIDWVEDQIKQAGLKPSKICFQISESVAAKHLKQSKAIAEKLRGIGFQIAVDHLGCGDDPRKLLENFPLDIIKIDGSLMQGLHRNSEMQDKVRGIAELASKRNIKTIAERVEDANTMAILWQLGISYIQGNYVQMQGVVLEDTGTKPVPQPSDAGAVVS
jgi:diguanylate cyclase (GGDEF)-like protein